MPIGITRPVAGLASTTDGTTYSLGAFTPAANSLLVVYVAATGTVAATPTITGGGLTWVLDFSSLNILSSGNSAYLFYAKVGVSPVSTTVTFTCTADAATGAAMSIFQFTGYDSVAVSPIEQRRIQSLAAGTNRAFSFTSALTTTNGYVLFLGTPSLAANSVTPPAGWTEGDDIAYITPPASLESCFKVGGETTVGPFTFTHASAITSILGVEVRAETTIAVSSKRMALLGVG